MTGFARAAAIALLLSATSVACGESTREFSSPPTLTPTSPAAATLTPRPVTAAPTAAPTLTPSPAPTAPPPLSPSPTRSAVPTTPAPSPSPTRPASPSPSPSPPASPQTTIPPGASLPVMPALPVLPTGSAQIASGTVTFAIAPGETRKFEPAELAAGRGAPPAPITGFAWTLAWRATESLTSAWYRDSQITQIGRGRWGSAELGGAGFQLRNDTGATVYGEIAYLIGSR